jgi:hypothetical protein
VPAARRASGRGAGMWATCLCCARARRPPACGGGGGGGAVLALRGRGARPRGREAVIEWRQDCSTARPPAAMALGSQQPWHFVRGGAAFHPSARVCRVFCGRPPGGRVESAGAHPARSAGQPRTSRRSAMYQLYGRPAAAPCNSCTRRSMLLLHREWCVLLVVGRARAAPALPNWAAGAAGPAARLPGRLSEDCRLWHASLCVL